MPGSAVSYVGFLWGRRLQTRSCGDSAGVIGSDGQVYDPATAGVTEGTNFSGGVFSVSPGVTVKGWVSFELPAGVTVARSSG
jgi:hypothetical protein